MSNLLCENINIADMRAPYRSNCEVLCESDLVSKDPLTMFKDWFEVACRTPSIIEPNAMTLATATKSGRPSARMVLFKGLDDEGFQFYTNYESRKGKELNENPYVAVVFHWESLHRSIRIEGSVKKLSEEQSANYFHSRPRDSQIAACASNQSSVLENRQILWHKYKSLQKQYTNENEPVKKPDYWGGYVIIPDVIEFWQGQTTRLHDRICFRHLKEDEIVNPQTTHLGENGWVFERLSP